MGRFAPLTLSLDLHTGWASPRPPRASNRPMSICRAKWTGGSNPFQFGSQLTNRVNCGTRLQATHYFNGEEGIRTPETVARLRDFQSRSFSHSDTSPGTAFDESGDKFRPSLLHCLKGRLEYGSRAIRAPVQEPRVFPEQVSARALHTLRYPLKRPPLKSET